MITSEYAISSWTIDAKLKSASSDDERKELLAAHNRIADQYFAWLKPQVEGWAR